MSALHHRPSLVDREGVDAPERPLAALAAQLGLGVLALVPEDSLAPHLVTLPIEQRQSEAARHLHLEAFLRERVALGAGAHGVLRGGLAHRRGKHPSRPAMVARS